MNRGFSLLELLVVISVITLLTILAYPTYHHILLRTNRIHGQTALLDLANRMERYYVTHRTYQNADILDTLLSKESLYQLSIQRATDSGYILFAKATYFDKDCPILVYDHLGLKGKISPNATIYCW